MTQLIDYAGLFPPAGLPMSAAVAEYAGQVAGAEAWMLGRFIVPASRLEELAAALEDGGFAADWRYALLVGDRGGAQANLEALRDQGAGVRAFADRQTGAVNVEALECPLPREVCHSPADLDHYLEVLREALVAAGLQAPTVYLELPQGGDDQLVIAALARAMARHGDAPARTPRPAAKLRCGGLTPEAFPSPDRVAAVLAACAREKVPLKCTAGLHHPLRHRSHDPEVMMHGFINVFGAGMLAFAGGHDPRDLEACVSETDPGAFAFGDGDFSWRDHRVSVAEIARLRRLFLHGFGSCSFAEPVADLRSWKAV